MTEILLKGGVKHHKPKLKLWWFSPGTLFSSTKKTVHHNIAEILLKVALNTIFIIYINDIADKLISLSRLFADDTSFGYSNRDTMQLKNVIAHDLNEMDIWSKKWLMSFNPDKTEIMIFSNRSVPENLDFSFNGKSVPITTSHKHLSVTYTMMLSGITMLIILKVVYLNI